MQDIKAALIAATEWAGRGIPVRPVTVRVSKHGWSDHHTGGQQPTKTEHRIASMFRSATLRDDAEHLAAGVAPGLAGLLVVEVLDLDLADSLGIPEGWIVDMPGGGQQRWFAAPFSFVFDSIDAPESWDDRIRLVSGSDVVPAPGTTVPGLGTWSPRTPWGSTPLTRAEWLPRLLTESLYRPEIHAARLDPLTVEAYGLLVEHYGAVATSTRIRPSGSLDVVLPGTDTYSSLGHDAEGGPGVLSLAVALGDDMPPGLYDLDRLRTLAVPRMLKGESVEVVAAVSRALEQRRVKDLVDGLLRPSVTPVDVGTLGEILGRPDEPPERITGLLPTGGRLLLVAQRKTGKTTWCLNLARALLTGENFLGTLPTRRVEGRVAMLNYEMSAGQIARWARDHGVPERDFVLINLRGSRNLLATPAGRSELVEILRSRRVEVLIVDPFGRAFTGQSQNSASEVGAWLEGLDEVAVRAGVEEVVLTCHAGWQAEHARGSSALEDWPEAPVMLVRDEDGGRYMSLDGRGVQLAEDRLIYDPASRRLVLSGDGNRKDAREKSHTADLVDALMTAVNASPGLNTAGITAAWKAAGFAHRGKDVQTARDEAERLGLVEVRPGLRGAREVFPTSTLSGGEAGHTTPTTTLSPIERVERVRDPRGRGSGEGGEGQTNTEGISA